MGSRGLPTKGIKRSGWSPLPPKLLNAGLDTGMIRGFGRVGHFGANRIQVNIGHAGGKAFSSSEAWELKRDSH